MGWSCPSNIALIKYWGKRPVQIPMNPSLSMTLNEARTKTRLEFDYNPANHNPTVGFLFEGKKTPAFEDRIIKFIKSIDTLIPSLAHTTIHIESENTFPHSSGIASSASSMGALALCLVQMEEKIMGPFPPGKFLQKASFIARLGSGSASRSVYPYFAVWGATENWAGSNDEYAFPVKDYHEKFHQLRNTILIVESGKKKISSSTGHSLMDSNPFSNTRFIQARSNLSKLKTVFNEGDWDGFIRLIELEAFTLHAMMMTSQPGFMLMQPGTLSIIEKVREFRNDTGCRIGFTLDAGANVHLLHASADADLADRFITSDLVQFCEDGRIIKDQMGDGPSRIKT